MEDKTTGRQQIKELTSQQTYWKRYLHEYWNHWDYDWRSNEESHSELGAKNVEIRMKTLKIGRRLQGEKGNIDW